MEFRPPFCPNTLCKQHLNPGIRFWIRFGFFKPSSRPERVQRFRCKTCRITFSKPTFCLDYWDQRPDLNQRLFENLVSGVGYRQTARTVHAAVSSLQYKARKLAAHAGLMHHNLSPRLPADRAFLLDEEETYEQASIRTLTMPVLMEREHWFVVATDVGTTRRLAALGSKRREWQQREELEAGPRPDQSRECVATVLKELDRRLDGAKLTLQTDLKGSYATIASEVFGDRVTHETTSGKLPRTTFNPLFPINTTLAMTRDNLGRLRRKSWLVTKKREWLQSHMNLFLSYRNYVRVRFNRDKDGESPAVKLQLLDRNLTVAEALGWRQDWGPRSIHPLSADGRRFIGTPVTASA